MARYTRHYSIEVCIRSNHIINFRLVDTGIGWVALQTGDTPEHALRLAQVEEPNCDFVLHRSLVKVEFPYGGGIMNCDPRRDADSRAEQYAHVLGYVAEQYSSDETLLCDVDRAIRLAYPAA